MAARRLLTGLAFALFAGASAGQDPFPALHARPVTLCEPAPACEQHGRFRLLGALELSTPAVAGLRFSQLSGLAWDERAGLLYAVGDKGVLFGLRPVFRNQRLHDVTVASAAHLIDPKTRKPVKYRRSDAEGLALVYGERGESELLVSFEGDPRLAKHRPDGSVIAELPLVSPLNDILQFHYNRMLEGVCLHPREGVLTAPEEPMHADRGASRLYRADGRSWQLPAARGGIVALECLPDGDVLVLERAFTPLTLHTAITLRRVSLPAGTPPGRRLETADSMVLDSQDGWKVDNFEGLTRHRGQRFFMISDNNDLFVQRTLLVYFELLGP
jgi:hypothetical protein